MHRHERIRTGTLALDIQSIMSYNYVENDIELVSASKCAFVKIKAMPAAILMSSMICSVSVKVEEGISYQSIKLGSEFTREKSQVFLEVGILVGNPVVDEVKPRWMWLIAAFLNLLYERTE
ncbi:hypothetical protein QAD02_001705 [Eretmocerus hayati]|uniref:Uncharacterized protein n=1 Tax=Eretmocerus hayati TaxID=131215 RepID=A0ACC2NH75_9HYME|nr:hypothetical protein QAD02_001705 [Eretmocerus hayati]